MKLSFSHWYLKEVSLGSSECVGLSQRLKSRATWGWFRSWRIDFTSDCSGASFQRCGFTHEFIKWWVFWRVLGDLQLMFSYECSLYTESESSNRKLFFLARDPRVEAKGTHFRTLATLNLCHISHFQPSLKKFFFKVQDSNLSRI